MKKNMIIKYSVGVHIYCRICLTKKSEDDKYVLQGRLGEVGFSRYLLRGIYTKERQSRWVFSKKTTA
jgi:hypothetical protein